MTDGRVRAFKGHNPNGACLVLTDAPDRDAAQATGRWIKSDTTVRVTQ